MIAGLSAQFSADFLTVAGSIFRVEFPMRLSLRIRVEFSPSRLSTQHLRSAYELVAPVVRRATEAPGTERMNARAAAQRDVRVKKKRTIG
jgi:hypothetical protein